MSPDGDGPVPDDGVDSPDSYDASAFERPSVTVDTIIFGLKDDRLHVLLAERDHWPFEGQQAFPGGFIDMEESLETAAERVLEDKTGVRDVYLEQLYTFGQPDRDPRTRVITVAYFALVNTDDVELSDDRADWYPAFDPPELAFDHDEILEYARKRLQWKLEYTPAVFSLLPEEFTLTQVQDAYEAVFQQEFDKRNFRKKIKKAGLVEETGRKTQNVSHRPAMLYRAARDEDEIVDIL